VPALQLILAAAVDPPSPRGLLTKAVARRDAAALTLLRWSRHRAVDVLRTYFRDDAIIVDLSNGDIGRGLIIHADGGDGTTGDTLVVNWDQESDSFVVALDKRSGKEVYLDGSWAEMFQQHIQAWQANTPTQEEVEDTLERYAGLAQNPVIVH